VTNPPNIVPEVRQTRSGRAVRAPSHLKDYVVYEASIMDDTSNDFTDGIDPVSLMMTSSQDTLYFHEILQEPDKMQFVSAMKEEINNHNVNKNWEPIRRLNIPKGNKFIPSVWAMRRKRKLVDGSVSKWKARLNVDGSKQVHGTNYWETYAPVAQWMSIRSILCLSSINGWK
jgi:Reverse transcriptase (RNA-dependent DNA polymerase)